jgi:hypothetical protein
MRDERFGRRWDRWVLMTVGYEHWVEERHPCGHCHGYYGA